MTNITNTKTKRNFVFITVSRWGNLKNDGSKRLYRNITASLTLDALKNIQAITVKKNVIQIFIKLTV